MSAFVLKFLRLGKTIAGVSGAFKIKH